MNAPLNGSLEHLLDGSSIEDSFLVTHSIEDTSEGETIKVEESDELTE